MFYFRTGRVFAYRPFTVSGEKQTNEMKGRVWGFVLIGGKLVRRPVSLRYSQKMRTCYKTIKCI